MMVKVMVRGGLFFGGWLFLAAGVFAPQPAGGQTTQPGQAPPGRNRPAAVALPAGVDVIRDVKYVNQGSKAQQLDLYLPKEAKAPLPLVVWIHGGAWKSGDKAGGGPALGLLRYGYAVASVNYRLSQEAVFPAQIEDCKAAIRWLRANAQKNNLDPNRIGVWGGSAGGHLVALLGTSGGVKELEGQLGHPEQSSRVQAVCDWYGPTDFLGFVGQSDPHTSQPAVPPGNDPGAILTQLFGGPVQERKELARLASPVTFVDKDDPPFLIMHGDQDRTVPCEQSKILYVALQKAGVPVELVVVPGAGHSLPGPENFGKVKEFFDRTLQVGFPTSQPIHTTTR